MTETDNHLDSLTLDKLAHGALAPDRKGDAEQHLGACARCREELAAVQAARQHFSRFVFPRTVAALEARAGVERASAKHWRWVLTLAPVLAVGLFLAIPFETLRPPEPEPAFTVKGGPTLHVFGRRDDRSFAVKPGDKLRAGDQLRFEVAPAAAHFLLVGSVDGAGHANIYVPFDGAESVAVPPDRTYVSEGSVILDATPGPERLFAWLSDQPISAASATAGLAALGQQGPAAIRAASSLPLPVPALRQTSFLLEKESP